jgi:hypothetical protein
MNRATGRLKPLLKGTEVGILPAGGLQRLSGPEIWGEDRLGRAADAEHIRRFLAARTRERQSGSTAGPARGFVLNIDAPWGTGKTFFLTRLADELRHEGHLVAFVNAWRDDHAEDPLVAVMAAIEDVISPFLRQKKAVEVFDRLRSDAGGIFYEGLKGGATAFAKKMLSDTFVERVTDVASGAASSEKESALDKAADAAIDKAVDRISEVADRLARKAIDDFIARKKSLDTFASRLGQVIAQLKGDRPMPLYVCIDELDRCRPTYAITLLERTKHLFETANVAFIVATDRQQLTASVKAVYGESFDAQRYLQRFFDITYRFAEPTTDSLVAHLHQTRPLRHEVLQPGLNATIETTLMLYFGSFTLGPRGIERCYEHLRIIAEQWQERTKIVLPAILPLLVAFELDGDVDADTRLGKVLRDLGSRASRAEKSFIFNDREGSQTGYSPLALADILATLQGESLGNFDERGADAEDAGRRWAASILVEERKSRAFSSDREQLYLRKNPKLPHSIMRDYASIVRSAGKFISR